MFNRIYKLFVVVALTLICFLLLNYSNTSSMPDNPMLDSVKEDQTSSFDIVDHLQSSMGVPSGENVLTKEKLQLPEPDAIAILDGMGQYQEYFLKNIPDIYVLSLQRDSGLVLSIAQYSGDDYYMLPVYGHVDVEEGEYIPIAIAYDFNSIIAKNSEGLYKISIITGEDWMDSTSTVKEINTFDKEDFVYLLTYVG